MHNDEIDERIMQVAQYIAESGATVRDAAKKFGISKSTVHKDMTGRLKYISRPLYKRVARVLEINRAERHIRGGKATKLKYLKSQKKKSR